MCSATSVAVLDDRYARRAAREFGIPLTRTLGLLVEAQQCGLISAVAPCWTSRCATISTCRSESAMRF